MKNNNQANTFLVYAIMLIIGGVVCSGVKIWQNHLMSQKIVNSVENVIPVEISIRMK